MLAMHQWEFDYHLKTPHTTKLIFNDQQKVL